MAIMSPEDLEARLHAAPGTLVVVDLRDGALFARAHVPGAISVPHGRWSRGEEPRQGQVHVVYAASACSATAARTALELEGRGICALVLAGGMMAWMDAFLPVESVPEAPTKDPDETQLKASRRAFVPPY